MWRGIKWMEFILAVLRLVRTPTTAKIVAEILRKDAK